MKILITGTTGYIGYKLAMAAAHRGYEVAALGLNVSSPNLPHHPHIKFFKGDITDLASITSGHKRLRLCFSCGSPNPIME